MQAHRYATPCEVPPHDGLNLVQGKAGSVVTSDLFNMRENPASQVMQWILSSLERHRVISFEREGYGTANYGAGKDKVRDDTGNWDVRRAPAKGR